MLWHWGDNGVFKAFVMADPARKSGVVMFANGQDALNVAKPIIDTAMVNPVTSPACVTRLERPLGTV
jgi:CubicO group peptidase (beta-lactamase class C family)